MMCEGEINFKMVILRMVVWNILFDNKITSSDGKAY